MIMHRSGFIGNTPLQQKNCAGCSRSYENQIDDYVEPPLYPDDTTEKKKIITNEKLQELQNYADQNDILLPSELNVSFGERKIADDNSDITEKLLPNFY